MSSNLPPGCTDAEIERQANGDPCARCGHYWADHEDPLDSDGTPTGTGGGPCEEVCECPGFADDGPVQTDPGDEAWGPEGGDA